MADDSVPPVTSLPRRTFLLGAGAALGAVACGSERATSATSTTSFGPAFVLIASFPQGDPYAVPGVPQRLPFLIAKGGDAPIDKIDGTVSFTVAQKGSPVGPPVTVTPHSEGLTRAYLPLEFTFPAAGVYDITSNYRGADLTATIQVVPPDQVTLPQRNAPLPPLDTPTSADARGVDPICTHDPPCPLHEKNLADSLHAGRPVAMLLATPKFCQTAICGPVLDELLAAATGRSDIDFIHVEPYANPLAVASIAQAEPSPLTTAYGMTFEPCLFVTNRAGVLVRRLDTIYDRTELAAALDDAVA